MSRTPRTPKRLRNRLRALACAIPLALAVGGAGLMMGCNGDKIKDPDKLQPTPPPRASKMYGLDKGQEKKSFWSWLPWVD